MTVIDDGASSEVLDSGGHGDAAPIWKHRRWKTAVAAFLCGATVLGAGWWWSHPTIYGGAGSEFGARPDRLVPVYVVMVEGPEARALRILKAEPDVRVFGDAQVDVLLCEGARIGVVYGDDVERFCFGPHRDMEQRAWDQVVLKVTPLQAGAVVVADGIDLTYSTRVQRGTELTGSRGVVVFPEE